VSGATIALGSVALVTLLWAAVVSWREDEHRAARRLLTLAIIVPAPFLAAGFASFSGKTIAELVLVAVPVALAAAFLIPTRRILYDDDDTPRARIDERDIMFSRRLLEPGTERFRAYYAAHPEHRAPDDAFRAKPGLLAKGSTAYDPHLFSAADASFWTIERLRPFVGGDAAPERVPTDAEAVTTFIKAWARKLGAVSVGVTELREYHIYTHVGRGPDYGERVALTHRFAVALTVEMDKGMLDSAPLGPTVMESAQQYVACGVIAVQIADYVRRLGFAARAHIDGNYRVICPLVARDAGLGEIGRMGLLMTPELGPRVRIAVVTTDLPLVPDVRRHDHTVIDFCTHCRKCAAVCPSHAIPEGERTAIDGVRRWRIDSEACYTFWCQVGTDCARCMAVCPYSHPDNLLHRLVRRGVRNSAAFRRAAVWGDDFLYGACPSPVETPAWMGTGRVAGSTSLNATP